MSQMSDDGADHDPDARPDDADDGGDGQDTAAETPDPEPDDEGSDAARDGRGDRGGHAAGGPGAQLQRIAELPRPPMPPKRTGVFLDPDDLREHVGGLLRVMLGGYEVDAYGNFTFTHEGARVFVTVGPTPIGPQVGVFSVTNLDVDLTPSLAAFLATTNHHLGFGSLSYDPDSHSVWLRHSLLGTTLDAPELQTTVAAVASTAAQIDDHIAERFGGRTFEEAPEEVQQAARPPEPSQDPYSNTMGYL